MRSAGCDQSVTTGSPAHPLTWGYVVELGGIEPLRGCVRRTCSGAIVPGQSAFLSVLQ